MDVLHYLIAMEEMNYNLFDVKIEETTNPNDHVSSKGVRLTFRVHGKKIGSACISAVDSDRPFLYDLEVVESERNYGYGTAIVEYCIHHYNAKELTVDTDNKIAIKMYKKLGFKLIKKFYDQQAKRYRLYMGR